MSVLIKGMDMPKNCTECSMRYMAIGYDWECVFSDDCVEDCDKKRLSNCPLTEIPTPHGRLIDADALLKTIEANDYMLRSELNTFDRGMFTIGIQQAIDEAPTIIEEED